MARGKSSNGQSQPATPAPTLKKSSSSSTSARGQQTLLGFFQKTPASAPGSSALPTRSSPRKVASPQSRLKTAKNTTDMTPAPSSDIYGDEDPTPTQPTKESFRSIKKLPSPASSPTDDMVRQARENLDGSSMGTPSRKAKKKVLNYAESDSEGADSIDEEVFKPRSKSSRARPAKKRRISDSGEEDAYEEQSDGVLDEDIEDFVVADDSDEEMPVPSKRKRPSAVKARKQSSQSDVLPEDEDENLDLEGCQPSTARQWAYDPDNPMPLQERSVNAPSRPPRTGEKAHKPKAHTKEPSDRYPWLAEVRDMDRHPPGHPDYDPRTIYVPPGAWARFSPFEKQYWEIKQKFWDTIVFFKKGKFYELYENDATVGHQLFDLKLTDRVNMRMVGVPESSLSLWANQFVAKGFKIARVDQSENALSKEMRERDEKANSFSKAKSDKDKVIRRELACVLTAGTLVDGSMLQDDMATYCASIKESLADDLPAFGITIVDTATGQFQLADFVDDANLTRFETFVAQIRPQELILEKGGVSVKTLRILKNNTGPTTIWNYLKPEKEFWGPEMTIKEIDGSDYFPDAWPQVLEESKEKELLMSAFGALTQYLRMLKIERDLITIGNFKWYDPIKKSTSLVLDGQTLINLEVLANSFDGGPDGTLLQLLNRCITPFGKRLFKAWVCHPLTDVDKINARLDAVDSLNADTTIRDRFSSQMTKLPDLERLISRIHSNHCRAQDFVKVLEGFEQTEYTISLLGAKQEDSSEDQGVIGQLIAAMPDLNSRLEYWKNAFDREKAREKGILVPERGIEEDFDESQDTIESIQAELNALLKKWRKELGSSAICFRDNGKEIYQLEVPVKVSKIPKQWDQMSATKQVKRYYFPELRSLIRKLQEAQEIHSQIVKEVASRFYARFDENYPIWLAAINIIAQLDCLISLAKASAGLPQPSCRPVFLDPASHPRSTLELVDLRHPCLLNTTTDFIPNTINLGGSSPNLSLLTGANAAGKSTVLRMTCIATIMAQLGCYLPCTSAALTPVDRIMSRLGAQDHIFAAQSTFLVELAETHKILANATPRSLVILDELGRGTSSHDGVSVALAVLHHLASQSGCLGFFATHYRALADMVRGHPEVRRQRMAIHVDDTLKRVAFLYRLEEGVADGSFGLHCASMCGISRTVVDRAEVAARERAGGGAGADELETQDAGGDKEDRAVPLGVWSDVAAVLRGGEEGDDEVESASVEADRDGGVLGDVSDQSLDVLLRYVENL